SCGGGGGRRGRGPPPRWGAGGRSGKRRSNPPAAEKTRTGGPPPPGPRFFPGFPPAPPPRVGVRRKEGRGASAPCLVSSAGASRNPASVENVRLGGPQFAGSWLFPVIPASPDTLVRLAK